MRIIEAKSYVGSRPWDAMDVMAIDHATVRIHWTDQPYRWHVNDGPEAFVVLNGRVDMHVRQAGKVTVHRLEPGIVFHAEDGDEHVAHPDGEARILVVEQRGSE
jgi:mannose-6-phosphate isomerase-like protein (cupin superfamily)